MAAVYLANHTTSHSDFILLIGYMSIQLCAKAILATSVATAHRNETQKLILSCCFFS